jgi:hypothetical protein
MKEVILHIGGPKTGSSYLQSVFSLNIEKLAGVGILYPEHRSFANAQKGNVSSGNGNLIFETDIDFPDGYKTLLSNELLFDSLSKDGKLETKILRKVDRLTVILYSRNLIETLVSTWGQAVKRGGESRALDDWLLNTMIWNHRRVLWWIDASKVHGFDLMVFNYSKRKLNLLGHFLGAVAGNLANSAEFVMPEETRVNRSMTSAEYSALRLLNKVSHRIGYLASDELVNKLPHVLPDRPRLQAETFRQMVERYGHFITAINSFVSEEDRIEIGSEVDFVADSSEADGLSADQIRILSEVIERRRPEIPSKDTMVATIRDTALKISRQEVLGLEDALELMRIAQLLRPDGPMINRKVTEWSSFLASEGQS